MNTEQRHAVPSSENVFPRSLPLQSALTDTQLVEGSQHGDQHAFALLVQRHQHWVFLLSMRLLHDPEDAKEATHEAFLAAWKGMSEFRGDALFSSWLYRIVYHCCLRVIDVRKREHLVQEEVMRVQQTNYEMEKEQLAMQNIERYEQQVMLQKHLEHLPDKYRVVLRLRYLQDRTYEEIADILAVPLGTIKTYLFRAKRLLKERRAMQHVESTM